MDSVRALITRPPPDGDAGLYIRTRTHPAQRLPELLAAYRRADGDIDPLVRHTVLADGSVLRFPRLRQPQHLRLGTAAESRTEWVRRHRGPGGRLADVRGPAGRSRAIARAVRVGLSLGEGSALIDERIRTAELAGQPLTLW